MSNNLFAPLINSIVDCYYSFIRIRHRLPNYIEYVPSNSPKIGNTLYCPIGITANNKTLHLVLDDANHACLISGVSGSGKSTCLNSIITSLLSYSNISLYLMDYKVTELGKYSSLRQTVIYQYEANAIEQALSDILDSIRQEYKQLLLEGKTHSNPLSTVKVLIVEELSIASKKALKLLAQITAIGRAVNYRIIVTIQRADGNIMNNQLKSLLTNRICFKQVDINNSNLVLNSPIASTISTVGRGYYSRDTELIEFQGYFITDDTISQIINNNLKTENINVNSKINNTDVKTDVTIKDINLSTNSNDTSWIQNL